MYERAHFTGMRGYVPGTQPGSDAVKLNTNENPLAPSPKVMRALSHLSGRLLQRYPDSLATGFRRAAAKLHGLEPEQVVATNGGDELLRLAVTTFVDPGRPIGIATPGYGLYSILAAIHQARLSAVALTEAWELPQEAAFRWNEDGAQLALITNPHAPSGALAPLCVIERLAATFRGVLLVDEAYVDFVDPAFEYDATALLGRYPNVLLLRTLSKGYALAGLRLGYGLGNAALIAPILAKTKDSYNVDVLAQHLGVAALDDIGYSKASWAYARKERALLADALTELGFGVEPSQTNFVLASPARRAGRRTARDLHIELEARGIYVRWFDEDRLRDRLRITVGTSEENAALIKALHEIF